MFEENDVNFIIHKWLTYEIMIDIWMTSLCKKLIPSYLKLYNNCSKITHMHLIINYNYKCTYNICGNFRALNFTDYMALNSNYSNCIKCKVLIYGIYIFFKISKDIWHHQKVNLQTLYIQRVFSRVSQNLKKNGLIYLR